MNPTRFVTHSSPCYTTALAGRFPSIRCGKTSLMSEAILMYVSLFQHQKEYLI